jgi:hypothetical protein
MSSRKVCISVLVLGLSLGTLSDLHALPLQRARGETRIQQALSNRIFEDLLEFWQSLVAAQHGPTGGNSAPEGSGLCPNGKPPGTQGITGNTGNNGNNGNNGNG